MDIISTLTDDQLALLGCFAAIVVSGTIMSLSYYVGPRRSAAEPVRTLAHVERLKRDQREERRAA